MTYRFVTECPSGTGVADALNLVDAATRVGGAFVRLVASICLSVKGKTSVLARV
jgi:hypothetical protein